MVRNAPVTIAPNLAQDLAVVEEGIALEAEMTVLSTALELAQRPRNLLNKSSRIATEPTNSQPNTKS